MLLIISQRRRIGGWSTTTTSEARVLPRLQLLQHACRCDFCFFMA